MKKIVLVCSSNPQDATRLQESLTDWTVRHSRVPTAIGDAVALVIETDLENAEVMANNALDADKVCISLVHAFHERVSTMQSGFFDAFQRRCLDIHVLGARIVQGLERALALKQRKAQLAAN